MHAFLFKYVDGGLNDAIRKFFFGIFPSLSQHVDPAFIAIKAFSFIIATFNGFYWNRRWTFRAENPDLVHQQLVRFYFTYVVGLCINTTVAGLVYHSGQGKWIYLLSLVVATVVTTGWTFPMNKFWTFRATKSPTN